MGTYGDRLYYSLSEEQTYISTYLHVNFSKDLHESQPPEWIKNRINTSNSARAHEAQSSPEQFKKEYCTNNANKYLKMMTLTIARTSYLFWCFELILIILQGNPEPKCRQDKLWLKLDKVSSECLITKNLSCRRYVKNLGCRILWR